MPRLQGHWKPPRRPLSYPRRDQKDRGRSMKISSSETGSFWKPAIPNPSSDISIEAYREFVKQKVELSKDLGFECSPDEVHPWLKPHQRAAVVWGVRGGRRALFESFGLGKTCQQLEILRLILKKADEHDLAQAKK